MKKGGCGFLRVGLEGFSPAALRRGWAADWVSDTQVSRFDLWETTEVIEAVCADWSCACRMMLSQRYLKTEYLKRYVGGLVQFDGSTSHIDFLGFWVDYGRTASLFERTPFLWKRCASNRKLSRLNNGTMCRGSNVKDKLATAFQLESLILAQNERWRQA